MFAQIGKGEYEPRHMKWVRLLDPVAFGRSVAASRLMVAHAGTGSVFAAYEHGVPTVLVPRYAAYREHTTDHQVDTANWLKGRPGLVVAERNDDLDAKIEEALALRITKSEFSIMAPEPFISRLKQSIDN